MELLNRVPVLCILFVFVAWSSASDNTDIKAIQILETADGKDDSRVLRIIERSPGRPGLKQVLTSDQTKHLPLLVFSVTGKTRSGKSFLLNLMHKYLKAEGNDAWKNGLVPNVFEWKEGLESTTKGLWISPTIFKRENIKGDEVGIVLMDNQGLFDGEVTSGESVAMSGVSTILSHVQMFNMKEDISSNDLENVMLHLVPDIPDPTNGNTTGTSLMFVIRDFIGGTKSGYGLQNGRRYINEEQNRGAEEYRSMWVEHRKVFDNIDCVLLPHPGLHVLTEAFTTSPKLSDLDGTFIREIGKFFRELFDANNLVPHKDCLTGIKIYELLEKVDGKKADKDLSYYNMYLDRINNAHWEQLIVEFNNKLNHSGALHTAMSLVDEITSKSKFRGPTAQQQQILLKQKLQDITNERVKSFIIEKYNNSIRSDFPKESHGSVWHILSSLMNGMLIGKGKEAVKNDIIRHISTIYYQRMGKYKEDEFKNTCEKSSSLDFVNNLLILNKEEELSSYVLREIEKNGDFENNGTDTASYAILQSERKRLGHSIKKIILRNMFKVKQYFVDYYSENLRSPGIINQNVVLWNYVKQKLDDLVFETEGEQTQTLKDIKTNIAKLYYERLRKEIVEKTESNWGKMNNEEFHEEYSKYNNSAALSELVAQEFPHFNGFESSEATEIWKNEKNILEVQLELAMYKGLKVKGYDQEASGFWKRYGEKILKVLGNYIVNTVLNSIGIPTISSSAQGKKPITKKPS